MRYLNLVWNWSTAPGREWASWLCHFTLGFLLSGAFGWWAATSFYTLREIEQAWRHSADGLEVNWQDHFFDLWWPALGAVLAHVIFGW